MKYSRYDFVTSFHIVNQVMRQLSFSENIGQKFTSSSFVLVFFFPRSILITMIIMRFNASGGFPKHVKTFILLSYLLRFH